MYESEKGGQKVFPRKGGGGTSFFFFSRFSPG